MAMPFLARLRRREKRVVGEVIAGSTVCAAMARLDWKGPLFTISALQKEGLKDLCYQIMAHVEKEASLLLED